MPPIDTVDKKPWQHRLCPKGKGQTNSMEAINCSILKRSGVRVRKLYSSSNACKCTKIISLTEALSLK